MISRFLVLKVGSEFNFLWDSIRVDLSVLSAKKERVPELKSSLSHLLGYARILQ